VLSVVQYYNTDGTQTSCRIKIFKQKEQGPSSWRSRPTCEGTEG
jgi:hypothetical protein